MTPDQPADLLDEETAPENAADKQPKEKVLSLDDANYLSDLMDAWKRPRNVYGPDDPNY